MHDIFAGGVRLTTADDVAEALLDYLRILLQEGRAELVTFPAVVEGETAHVTLAVGVGSPIVASQTISEIEPTLEGTDLAAWSIRRRTSVLRGERPDLDWRENPAE
ncbi:hypothetical protein ACTU3I_11235 [Microbacterium sp. RD1]|uniref:hypothetical protein n=1 Tax=Microbacterium sp. RD1 TaxID=3457313 RepID=UPI003FA59A32